jgi:23S rRNA (cytosine1962-C5)-methyltransferase
MYRVVLRSGKEKPVEQRHPWVFSGAIARIDDGAGDGDVVDVVDGRGRFLARGYLNRRSQIAVRLLTWDADEAIDARWLGQKLDLAIEGRRLLLRDGDVTAMRWVNAESDGLPGLTVDQYGDYVVVQMLTLGIERWREAIVALLQDRLHPAGIFHRGDVDVRRHEGLAMETGPLTGSLPPERVEILERGRRFGVDIKTGQKTGFYLDQRDNRARAVPYFRDAECVLNCFAYTGGFGVYAAGAGARAVVSVDSSADALAVARDNMALNGAVREADEWVVGDVFQVLRQYRDQGRTFDAIVLDPPKFAASQGQVQSACRGYKDINLLALRLLKPGGFLLTFSCSGLVSADLFQKVVFGASLDAGRTGQILEKLSQATDHPILLTFPESEYLKGLVVRAE